MELSKTQFKDLLYAINWEIDDLSMQINEDDLKVILDKALIGYEVE